MKMVAALIACVLLEMVATTRTASIPSEDIDSILYYETLSPTNSRTSREADHSVHLQLTAFNRSFHAEVKESVEGFDPSAKFVYLGQDVEPLTFYKGKLFGEPYSSVKGYMIDGVFDGIIMSAGVEYHIEQAAKFFNEKPSFHSIIYRSHEVHQPQTASCGVKGRLLEELASIQAKALPTKEDLTLYGRDRVKRLSTPSGNRFCQMFIAADHLFLANIGGGNVAMAMSEMITIMSQVQSIFQTTDFDGDGTNDGIVPLIARLEVMDLSTPGYRFSNPSVTVNEYLDLWSQIDHEKFCLALLFTYRDFDGGVLGLAWVAQPPGGNRGGICEDRVTLNIGPRYLNTAIVSMLNFGRRQPRSVTVITTAHEIGHNFGSPHDPGSSMCSPGFGGGGNYLMFPQATDGSQPNNNRFSPCSRASILPVLQSTKSDCFKATGIVCGNGILEPGEECDCGDKNMCASDPCCFANCTLTIGSSCSPAQVCCNETCQFRGPEYQCRDATECGQSVNCTGLNAICPSPNSVTNNVLCNNGNNFCVNGVCSGSVCVREGLQDCQCTTENERCHVCCIFNGQCVSTQTTQIPNIMERQLFREAGRSCNNFTGYCDSDNICRVVDNERTLNDLLDLFTLDTLNTIVAWLSTYWYIPVGVIIGLAVLIILLQVTYRKRKPIKRRLSRRGRGDVSQAQSGGVGQAASPSRPVQRRISPREALSRLGHFFPTADRSVIQSVVQNARSESKAVKKLLDLGYSMRRVPIPRA